VLRGTLGTPIAIFTGTTEDPMHRTHRAEVLFLVEQPLVNFGRRLIAVGLTVQRIDDCLTLC
jgi:hypothetical protein